MSISKIVIMGTVVRNPEKRFTSNNIPITYFSINTSKNEEPSLIRVMATGKLAETTADSVKKDKVVIVEGRLQNGVMKDSSGNEKKVVEISARAVEIVNEIAAASTGAGSAEDFDYSDEVSADELIGEDEIPF